MLGFHKQAYPVIWPCEIISGSLLYYHFMKALRKRQWFHSAFNTEHNQHKDFDFVFLPVVILKQKYKPSSQFILKGDLVTTQSLMGNTVYTEILITQYSYKANSKSPALARELSISQFSAESNGLYWLYL